MNRKLTLVSMSGLRVGHEELLDLGMRFPGLSKRASALQELPPLGLLTVAAMVPDTWDIELISDLGAQPILEIVELISDTKPDLVAFSALTPSADRAALISSSSASADARQRSVACMPRRRANIVKESSMSLLLVMARRVFPVC